MEDVTEVEKLRCACLVLTGGYKKVARIIYESGYRDETKDKISEAILTACDEYETIVKSIEEAKV